MSGRAWIVLLVVMAALGLLTWLFVVQNSARTVVLSLDLGFAAWQTARAVPVPALLAITFGSGFLLAILVVLPRMAAQGRRLRALERQVALSAPAQDPWR